MTIPTRPAPAPPGSHGQIAASGANASIEQLRLQLQQQQEQQQQLHGNGMQKLTIKLPPPPKGGNTITNYNNNVSNHSSASGTISNGGTASSITRKFPQVRYTPTTNWSDSPFETAGATTNGNMKKVPPPRPPPPKVQVHVNGRKTATTPTTTHSANILTNIFNRKKSTKLSSTNANATRIYGMSSGTSTYNTTTNNMPSNSTYSAVPISNATSSNNYDWNAAWNTVNYSTTTSSVAANTTNQTQDMQLISFDSPPSSPTFTQKSNSDCLSVDSFSSDSNFSSPNNGSVSQPESGFEDDFSATRSRPATTSPLDPWETVDAFGSNIDSFGATIGTAPVRNLNSINTRPFGGSNDNPLCNGKSLLPPAPSLNMPTIIKPKISQKPRAPKPPLLQKHCYSTKNSILDTNLPTPPSPPMPQCAPPPPPTGVTLLDVISGKVDAIHLYDNNGDLAQDAVQPYGIALYDFEGTEEGDLCFRENEKIYLLERVSAEWYRGRTRAGCEGIFPVNYIEIKVPLAEATNAASTTTSAKVQTIQNNYPRVRCLYNFPAEVEGDLELQEGDLVTILYKINEDWLYGEINNRQGQFPTSFLEYVPDNLATS